MWPNPCHIFLKYWRYTFAYSFWMGIFCYKLLVDPSYNTLCTWTETAPANFWPKNALLEQLLRNWAPGAADYTEVYKHIKLVCKGMGSSLRGNTIQQLMILLEQLLLILYTVLYMKQNLFNVSILELDCCPVSSAEVSSPTVIYCLCSIMSFESW